MDRIRFILERRPIVSFEVVLAIVYLVGLIMDPGAVTSPDTSLEAIGAWAPPVVVAALHFIQQVLTTSAKHPRGEDGEPLRRADAHDALDEAAEDEYRSVTPLNSKDEPEI